jgi:integrase
MATAEKHFPETVIPFAVALFTGMRQAEVKRLEPEDFTKDGINVPAENDRKNNRRRFIGIPAPLTVWLREYPIKDSVIPANWDRKYDAVRRLAGWRVWSDLVPSLHCNPKMPESPPEDAPEWPTNALRHTAATVALLTGKTLQDLIFEHGHTEGEEMLKRHYIGAMSKAEAARIWAIRPKEKKSKAPRSSRNTSRGRV